MLRQLADKTGGKITEAVVDPSKVPCPPPSSTYMRSPLKESPQQHFVLL
jgi:hypothetical protein